MNRDDLKKAISALLDALGKEHPKKHQPAHAARYVVNGETGSLTEVMFEKGRRSPPNIWVAASKVSSLAGSAIPQRPSLASSLRSRKGANGKLNYGRHSALEEMPELGEADLVCFAPRNLEEVGRILDALKA